MQEGKEVGFGDRFEYKGKFYHYMKEIKVKMRNGKDGEWVVCVLYYNNSGSFAREKKEFFRLFTPCQR